MNWYCSLDTQVINHLIEKKNSPWSWIRLTKMLGNICCFFLHHYCSVYERKDSGIECRKEEVSDFTWITCLFRDELQLSPGWQWEKNRVLHFKQAGNCREGSLHSAVLRQGRWNLKSWFQTPLSNFQLLHSLWKERICLQSISHGKEEFRIVTMN